MIRLTRMCDTAVVLNADVIQTLEATPDTVITLTNGEKLVVRETMDEIIRRVIRFRRALLNSRYSTVPEAEKGLLRNG